MSSTTLLSAYEQERLSNIAKNESKLRELGLLQSITPQDTPRDIPQEDKASKHGIHKEKRESLSEPRHRRKCTRLNSVDVDSGGLSDAFFRSEKWLTDDPFSTTIELETLETDLKKQKKERKKKTTCGPLNRRKNDKLVELVENVYAITERPKMLCQTCNRFFQLNMRGVMRSHRPCSNMFDKGAAANSELQGIVWPP